MTAPMTAIQIQAEARRRQRLRSSSQPRGGVGVPLPEFVQGTKIKTPQEEGAASVPFQLWPAQQSVLLHMEHDPLLVILKARQLGISWLACAYILWLCTQHAGKTVLLFSQGQLEANELIERISFMYYEHGLKLPPITRENTQELGWGNGSSVKSLPATKKAGRSFTASLVVFDEFAFMLFGASLYAAAKPTIDDGGKLWLISSADGQGTAYHQFWLAAQSKQNGFTPIFLDWRTRPSRDSGWRGRKIAESYGDTAMVLREYPENDIEAFTHAAGLVYGGVWSDGPEDGNVTERADYIPGGGDVLLGADDGYAGKIDQATGQYTALSHPRVFGLYQLRHDGTLCRFDESYAVETLPERQIAEMLALPFDLDQVIDMSGDAATWVERVLQARQAHPDYEWYPLPDYAIVDSSAAELRGRLLEAGIGNFGGTHNVEEGIKVLRRFVARDMNGRRRLLVHPRCTHFRFEMASYRQDDTGKVIKQHDHGPDECRMLCFHLRDE